MQNTFTVIIAGIMTWILTELDVDITLKILSFIILIVVSVIRIRADLQAKKAKRAEQEYYDQLKYKQALENKKKFG